MFIRLGLFVVLLTAWAGSVLGEGSPVWSQQAQEGGQGNAIQKEEEIDYYRKWIDEDVLFIISSEEREVFLSLSNAEEKERFIEQFWQRRDPDFRTAQNEFKDEHYRRIAYANEQFTWALPGWVSDRGRIYIIHGQPGQIEDHSGGGDYNRPMWEGGGSTVTYPFYIWRYRHIEGVGPDVELEFVDQCMCGEFALALRPEEKDAFLNTPSMGMTEAEMMQAAERKDRPYFNYENRVPGRGNYPLQQERYQDNPFVRYERWVNVGAAPEIKYKDLKQIVEINLSYDTLPFKVREDQFRLNDTQILVPVTIEFENSDLSFESEGTLRVARMGVYGIITSLTGKIVEEFEDDVHVSFASARIEEGLAGRSVYQKIFTLGRTERYKLDLVVKDTNTGNAGVVRRGIVPDALDTETLQMSPLIVSDKIEPLESIPSTNEMFVLGDVKVRPSISKVFPLESRPAVYLQVYNASLDQSTFTPLLEVRYRLLLEGQTVAEMEDLAGQSVQFQSVRRTVLIKNLPQGLIVGTYRLEVEVKDPVKDQKVIASEQFRITGKSG